MVLHAFGGNDGGHILNNVSHHILEDSDADYILEYNDGGHIWMIIMVGGHIG